MELGIWFHRCTHGGRAQTMTTIADVARRAGVGVGTASRVLNDSPHVTESTKARVLAAIKELNYRQTRGGTVRPKPRRQIGVLLPFIEQPATYQRLQALVRRLQPHGFDVLVMHVDSPLRARERIYELPRHPYLSGLVVLSLPLGTDEGHVLAQAPFPVIALDTSHPALSGVEIDDRGGGRMAASYMLSLGHRRIAFLGEARRNPFGFASSARREDGFKAALHDAVGLQLPHPGGQQRGPDAGERVGEFGVALRPRRELPHDQQRPALADHVKGVGESAELAIGPSRHVGKPTHHTPVPYLH